MLGVNVLMKPLARRFSSKPWTAAFSTLKTADDSGRLSSRERHWSLVSRAAGVTPLGSSGSGTAALLRTSIAFGTTSIPNLAALLSFTTPLQVITSS